MKTMIKAAFVVASLTAGVAMADTPKKPDVTKPADKDAKAGSGSGSATMGKDAGSAKTGDKTPAKPADKTPAKPAGK